MNLNSPRDASVAGPQSSLSRQLPTFPVAVSSHMVHLPRGPYDQECVKDLGNGICSLAFFFLCVIASHTCS